MIEEKALIVKTDDHFAWVETQRQTTCSTCSASKGCGTSVLQKVLGQKRTHLKVLNPNHYREGDTVILGLREDALVKGSFLMYGSPLLFMFGFAMLGYLIFSLYGWTYGELAKIGFSLSGLVIGFAYIARINNGIATDPTYQAVILRKADSQSNVVQIV
jgi:sigma-E factor negative regulatory protein RseC